MGRRKVAAQDRIQKGGTTRDTVQALKGILGSYGPVTTYTRISAQRLQAIAEGKGKLTQSEAQRISAYARKAADFYKAGAYKIPGVSRDLVYQQLKGLSVREFIPKEKMTVLDVALYFNPDGVQTRRGFVTGVEWVQGLSDARGISVAYLEAGGVVSAFGDDGQRYVAYIVVNQQTQERRFFWGRWDAVAELPVMDFRDMYGLTDDFGYDVMIGLIEGSD